PARPAARPATTPSANDVFPARGQTVSRALRVSMYHSGKSHQFREGGEQGRPGGAVFTGVRSRWGYDGLVRIRGGGGVFCGAERVRPSPSWRRVSRPREQPAGSAAHFSRSFQGRHAFVTTAS